MSFAARQKYTVGEIVNLQSIDAGRLEGNMAYLHMIWSAPLQIIISLVMLWQVVGWSVLAGLGVMVLLIPINLRISKVLVEIQKTMMVRLNTSFDQVLGSHISSYFSLFPPFRNTRMPVESS
jgi:ATP-binding cassette subfamily C (CFTR/MRP) protein 1